MIVAQRLNQRLHIAQSSRFAKTSPARYTCDGKYDLCCDAMQIAVAALMADAEGRTMARGKTRNSRTVASSSGALLTMKTAWVDNMLFER
jgi:hypothetical protein